MLTVSTADRSGTFRSSSGGDCYNDGIAAALSNTLTDAAAGSAAAVATKCPISTYSTDDSAADNEAGGSGGHLPSASQTDGIKVNNITTKNVAVAAAAAAGKRPYSAADHPDADRMPDSIEEWEEMLNADDDITDTRKSPEYTMTYRQAVGAEDVFLQLGNRTTSSASCEDLVIDIFLINDTTPVDKMNLMITETLVDFSSTMYHLHLPLMHKVAVDSCTAKYYAEMQKMSLILRMKREFDYVNF